MISEKVKNAAEKVMPKEKRFIEKVEGFFEKKSRRLIFSSITALVFLYPIYALMFSYNVERYYVLLAFLGIVELTAAGAFFANINKFSLKKFAIAAAVWSVVVYVSVHTAAIISAMDLTRIELAVAVWLGQMMLCLPICATATALTTLLAYFTVCRKTK